MQKVWEPFGVVMHDPEPGHRSLEQAFLVSPTNRGLLEQITQIMKMFQDNPNLEETCGKETVSSWVFGRRDTALRNLKKFHKDDVEGVVQSSISHGGPMFLKEWCVNVLIRFPKCCVTL